MIRQISGTIASLLPAAVVVDVNGVGYLINTSTPGTNFNLDQSVTFHTHMAVQERALDLYGFITLDELEVFQLLLTLPKIGPKSAAQILSQAEISLLKEAVAKEDATYLSKMSGIGKKSAEKIVLGLKDKFADAGYETGATAMSPGAKQHTSDTIDALVSLGYPQSDARKVVQQLAIDQPEHTDSADVLKAALKLLSN